MEWFWTSFWLFVLYLFLILLSSLFFIYSCCDLGLFFVYTSIVTTVSLWFQINTFTSINMRGCQWNWIKLWRSSKITIIIEPHLDKLLLPYLIWFLFYIMKEPFTLRDIEFYWVYSTYKPSFPSICLYWMKLKNWSGKKS